jgi:hypothetical protein
MYIQKVPKPLSQTSPGYLFPTPNKAKKKFLSTWVQKWTGSEISTYFHLRVSFEYYIRCSNECENEFASFPQTLRYAPNCSATWKSTIRKCFSIQTPYLMCTAIGTTAKEVNVCHLSKRVVFGLHHESNASTHFNCSELSTSSDGLYGAVVCSRTTHWIRVIAYPSAR